MTARARRARETPTGDGRRAMATARPSARTTSADEMTSEELGKFTASLLEQMQGRFQTMSDAIITKIDEMSERIDELERGVREIASETAGRDEGGGKRAG